MHRDGLGFSDALYLAQSDGGQHFYTFDKTLIKKSDANDVCPVSSP